MTINLEISLARLEKERSDLEVLLEEKIDAYAKLKMQYKELRDNHMELQSKYFSLLNQRD